MPNDTQRLALPPLRIYSRTEFTLLRARLYFDIHSLETREVKFDASGEQETTACDAIVLLFVYATGLRRVEGAAVAVDAPSRGVLDDAPDDRWSLPVMGKGRRARTVPMPRRINDEQQAQLR
ncbi:hypothetical protein WK91_02005 [Burkholderia cepacia]|uniref:hypothetical protein n=1 Tax=Burkholderia cepacia TaxID=292 RepID=UPI000757A662|nr:hypothetical protein [Burkholderia cepacia]KVW05376.1 hypothetical protein WK91_02005 [Burkholderia cepacia]